MCTPPSWFQFLGIIKPPTWESPMTHSVRPGKPLAGPRKRQRSHGVSVSGAAHRRSIQSFSSACWSHRGHTCRPHGSGAQFYGGIASP